MSSIPDSVRYNPMFIEPTITWVPSRFSGYIWLDTKNVLKSVCEIDGTFFIVYPANLRACTEFHLNIRHEIRCWHIT